MRCSSGQATTAAAVYFLTGRGGIACRTGAAGSDSTVAVEERAVEGHRCGRTGEVPVGNSIPVGSCGWFHFAPDLPGCLNVELRSRIVFPPFGFRQAVSLKKVR